MRRNRKREAQEIVIVGMESLYSVFILRCAHVTRLTGSTERDKAIFGPPEAHR